MATETEALRLVETLEAELLRRRTEIDRNEAYYRGTQPLKYASDEFRKYHGARYAEFSDNWVQVVADAPVERLTVTGILPSGMTEADKESWRVWQMNALDADSQLGFLGAVNSGRSFVLVWGSDDPETPEVTFEDASQCIVVYWPGSRRNRRAALKRWEDGECDYATLYLADEVWKFERPRLGASHKSVNMREVDDEMEAWAVRDTGEEPNPQFNPLGVVPMVELPNKPTLSSEPISDVSGVIALQDAVNLLWAQLFTAADYASFPTRIVLGAERPVVPVLDESGQIIGERPVDMEKFAVDRVQFFSGDDVSTSEWSAANLNAYSDIIETAVGHIAAQTRTPQHYLVGKMANLSADALLAAETGLVKRVEEKQIWFGQALREVFRLIALAQGDDAKALAIAGGRVLWAEAESRSQAQLTDSLVKLKSMGFPFEFLALRYGLTPTEVADLMAMKERELASDPMGAFTQIMGQQGGNPGGEQPDSAAAPSGPGANGGADIPVGAA
jgi:hypothetical protein